MYYVLYFGYWFNGGYLDMVRALAHDLELQPSELEGAPEKCPTSSVQEVHREPACPGLSITCHRGSPWWMRYSGSAGQTQSSRGSLWPPSLPRTTQTAAGDGRITFIPLVPARSSSKGALPLKRRSKIPPLPHNLAVCTEE